VEGRCAAGVDALDVFKASFPAGTVTGAPKVRAMQIIDELEPVKRGVYSGAVGYLGFNGDMDVAIAIRTAVVKDGQLHVQAAAGIVDHLRLRAAEQPDALHARYLHQVGPEELQTYDQLQVRTRQHAQRLAEHGTTPGGVVLVVLQHSAEMLPVFYGAMWLGAIPAFLPFPTGRLHLAKYFGDLRALVERTLPQAIVTYRELADELRAHLADAPHQPRILLAEGVAADAPLAGPPHPADPEDVACIQYSSGSTGLQKGAALSHRAILNECRGVGEFFELTRDDVFVTWVPLYHDWGLVCDAIHPLVLGAQFVLLSPIHWVSRPAAVLEAITRYRATVYWQPNFAFNFMAKRVREEELAGVDLSSLRLCGNGAEPCLFDSHEVFARRFEGVGFRREALGIVYGMAEVVNSVVAAGNREPIRVDVIDRAALQERHAAVPCDPASEGALRMLGVGRGLVGTELVVVDDARRVLPDRQVGEIALRSTCLFNGYYRNEQATADRVADGWYYGGDLGYIADGVLYVTGRKSDQIIIGGENFYPQDIEYMVAEHPHVVAGRVAAIGVEDAELGTQRLVVIAESKSDDPEVHRDIKRFVRRELAARLNVKPDRIVVAPHKWLYKTSSGKIARLPNLRRLHELGAVAAGVDQGS
ncbi:MAG TPA: AMP-binding protein, partial [Planctomycetota bacterium]|nr:AMP-binding protein [Planctomycetota bacterium]